MSRLIEESCMERAVSQVKREAISEFVERVIRRIYAVENRFTQLEDGHVWYRADTIRAILNEEASKND